MAKPVVRKRRAAVYTRKSSEEGLELPFNSLDSQREACHSYIASQKAEGWVLVGDRYDDGGFSGGTLDRPALRRLLTDIEAGKADVVVVYKLDRLSRSLMDFAKLVEVFEQHDVTFVSITQSFNTTTSMGRLTLNVLLSFAQFEREVIGERIRDKFAASRKKGMWMGGYVPFGYAVQNRKLIVREDEASIVRMVFDRFRKTGSATLLARALAAEQITTRSGKPFDKGNLYKLLKNEVYIGKAVHKGIAHRGEHHGIVPQTLWDKVQAILKKGPRTRAGKNRAQTPALLRGIIFASDGRAMSPTHTRKSQRLYRYYISQSLIKGATDLPEVTRVPAGVVEAAVTDRLRILLRAPAIVVATWKALRREGSAVAEAEVREAIGTFDQLWEELFPAEQARLVRQLVDRVEVHADSLDIRLRTEGLGRLVSDLLPAREHAVAIERMEQTAAS